MDLFDRIRNGDRDAEQELLLQFIEEIRIIVRYQLRDASDHCEDLTHEICIVLIENLRKGKYDPQKAKLGSYIYGIAKNKIADFRARDAGRKIEDLGEKDIAIPPEFSEQIEREEFLAIMRQQLVQLKPKYRNVLILRYHMDYSISEIAQILGIANERVSERIYYAIELLRKKCEKYFP